MSGTASKNKQLLAGVLVAWLGCSSQITAAAQDRPHANWTSADAPCAKYDDLRNPVLGDIGVKIDATEPWADGFRRALSFWNRVLAANFHEQADLDACAIRIVNGGPELLNHATVARSQLTEWGNFRGKIAVSPGAAGLMSSAEIYGVAVHELGHMLGLKHNPSTQSIMYFLDVNGTEILDRRDILDLSTHHKLRLAAGPTGFLSIKVVLISVPIPISSGMFSSADWSADSPAARTPPVIVVRSAGTLLPEKDGARRDSSSVLVQNSSQLQVRKRIAWYMSSLYALSRLDSPLLVPQLPCVPAPPEGTSRSTPPPQVLH